MNIGKKIKNLRTEKLMTQSELAGEVITRNMLSQIENGIAQPSLSTVIYLAKRLGVPAGYLLSEGEEEFLYNKTSVMKNIKRAYLDKNYELCREMCISSFDEYDDELEIILTDCCIGEAEYLIRNGRLYHARERLDEAMRHADKTIYSTVTQKNRARILFYLLKNISPTLDSNEIDTDIAQSLLHPIMFEDTLCRYISLFYGSFEFNDPTDTALFENVEGISAQDRLYREHIMARNYMRIGEYGKALELLKSITDGETVPERLLLFICCEDIEKCCKELEDYKGAYEFSNNRMEILEHMLVEI